ncbi:Hypothetical predicted protein, partial [Pelobates cultripes]
VAFTLQQSCIDEKGRYIIIVCLFNNVQYTLVATYFPNDNQAAFRTTLLNKVDRYKLGGLIIGGDINFIQSPSLDTTASLT